MFVTKASFHRPNARLSLLYTAFHAIVKALKFKMHKEW